MYIEFDKKVGAALKGDSIAKEWIIDRLKPLIVSYSKKYGRQIGWDEELYQEGAWQILEALNVFDTSKGVPFLGFVTIRLKHHYQNRRRKEKITISLDQFVGEDDGASLLDLLVDEKVSIESDYFKKEEYKALIGAINKLDAKERGIIEDYYLKGNTLKDIAETRKVHYVTVAKGKAKALEKLKSILYKVG